MKVLSVFFLLVAAACAQTTSPPNYEMSTSWLYLNKVPIMASPCPSGQALVQVTFNGGVCLPFSGSGSTPGGTSGQFQFNNSGVLAGLTFSGDVTVNSSTGVATVQRFQGIQVSATPPTNNQVWQYSTSASQWQPVSLSLAPGGATGQFQYNNAGALGGFTMSGDVTVVTSTGVATLGKIQGVAVSSATPTNGQVWQYITADSQWEPTGITYSGDITVVPSTGVATVKKIQGFAASSTTPTNGQVWQYNTADSQWEPTALAASASCGSQASWLTCAIPSGVLAITAATGQTAHQVIMTGTGAAFGPGALALADLPSTVVNTSSINSGTFPGAFTQVETSGSGAGGIWQLAGGLGSAPATTGWWGLFPAPSMTSLASFGCYAWPVSTLGILHATGSTPCFITSSPITFTDVDQTIPTVTGGFALTFASSAATAVSVPTSAGAIQLVGGPAAANTINQVPQWANSSTGNPILKNGLAVTQAGVASELVETDSKGNITGIALAANQAAAGATCGVGAGSGTGLVCGTPTGTANSGQISITTATGTIPTTGAVITIAFAASLTAAPFACQVQGTTAATTGLGVGLAVHAGTPTTAGFQISSGGTALASGVAYAWSWICL